MSKELTLIGIIVLALFADLMYIRQTLFTGQETNQGLFFIVLSQIIIAGALIVCLVFFVRKAFFKQS